jgi:hypothetical protein
MPYMPAMKTHSQIAAAVPARDIAELTGKSIHTVRSWAKRDSIPSRYWPHYVQAGAATVEELLAAQVTAPSHPST